MPVFELEYNGGAFIEADNAEQAKEILMLDLLDNWGGQPEVTVLEEIGK